MHKLLEVERLATFEHLDVLDTSAAPLFDSLAQLAAQTFNTPMALISVFDHAHRGFLARVGLGVEHMARDISFCQHTIVSDDVFVVRDAAEDARFRASPLVAGPPNIRFYAGAPLVTPDGGRLGALCVIDTKPRDFTEAEASRLQAISRSVTQALLLHSDRREGERVAVMAARPGRIIADVAIDEPYPRTAAYRLAPAFAARCQHLSDLVADAHAGASA